jgi:fructose 1,6-bisphosphatase
VASGELISVDDVKADVGGTWGHTKVPLPFTAVYKAKMLEAIEKGILGDGNSFGTLGFDQMAGNVNIGVGDDGHMIMIGDTNTNSIVAKKLAFSAFIAAYLLAFENPEVIGTYGLGQDLAGPEAALALQNPYAYSEFSDRFFEILKQVMPQDYLDKGVIDVVEKKWREGKWDTKLVGDFSGNVSGQGAGSARYTLDPTQEESFMIIAGDKMGPAAFNRVIEQGVLNAVDSGEFENGLVIEIWDAKAFDKDGNIAIKDIPRYDDIKYNFALNDAEVKKLDAKVREEYLAAKALVERAYVGGQLSEGLTIGDLHALAKALKRFGYVPTKRIFLDVETDKEAIGLYLADSDRFNVKYIWSKKKAGWDINNPQEYLDRPVMGSSVTKLGVLTGGEYIGKDDPVMVGSNRLLKNMAEFLRTQPIIVQGDMFGSHWVEAVPVALKHAAANIVSHPIIAILNYKVEIDDEGKPKFVQVEDIAGTQDYDTIRTDAYEFNREFRFAALGGEVEPYGTHKDTVEASYGLAKHLNELNRDDSPYLLSNKRIRADQDGWIRSWPELVGDTMPAVYDAAVRDEASTASADQPEYLSAAELELIQKASAGARTDSDETRTAYLRELSPIQSRVLARQPEFDARALGVTYGTDEYTQAQELWNTTVFEPWRAAYETVSIAVSRLSDYLSPHEGYLRGDQAMSSLDDDFERANDIIKNVDSAQAATPYGGIDLNPEFLKLQIKRDGRGIPLPMNLQSIETIKIDGFVPLIINITPINNVPMLLGIADQIPAEPVQSAQHDTDRSPVLSKGRFEMRDIKDLLS